MIFAASNIAWSYADRLSAYDILRDSGLTGLEIAPGLLFEGEADPFEPSVGAVRARIAELDRAGLRLVSMQSLLFGVQGAELFGSPDAVERMAHALRRAVALAARIGIANLVFGSPRQRIVPQGMTQADVLSRVRAVFAPLGDLAAANGTVIAMEPNPREYGTNFMTTFLEALEIVEAVAHPAVTLNFDTGALHMTNEFERVSQYLVEARDHISHVHVSSAFLGPAPAAASEAATLISALVRIGYERAVSIEMKADTEGGLEALAACVGRLRDGAHQAGIVLQ